MHTATFDRPISGTLIVRLENGNEFEASAEDVRRFGFIDEDAPAGRFSAIVRDLETLSAHTRPLDASDRPVIDEAIGTLATLVNHLTSTTPAAGDHRHVLRRISALLTRTSPRRAGERRASGMIGSRANTSRTRRAEHGDRRRGAPGRGPLRRRRLPVPADPNLG
ncbi:hypothetical protein V6N00_13645 [Tersicoccus sp. MR15.9]|uniref:hypothetical protein n=1 Tax=Tersicoccus mangrovi TaxID=3121635 RepID=UPI002FE5AA8C